MAMIGRNAAIAEVGKHRHEVEGPLAFAAWLGVHAMLLTGTHSKTDAFLTWAWDYFDRDHAATVEASTVPRRIAWGDNDQDVPHISLDRPQPADTPAATRDRHGRRTRRAHCARPLSPVVGEAPRRRHDEAGHTGWSGAAPPRGRAIAGKRHRSGD